MTAQPTWQVIKFGDSAVLARAEDAAAERCWRAVRGLADALERDGRVSDLVATYDSLLVEFDSEQTGHAELIRAVYRGISELPAEQAGSRHRTFCVPVIWGGPHGPDLPSVAEELGVTEQDVVEGLCEREFTIRFLGAPVGAPMMDGTPFTRPISRRSHPRTAVEAGSVALSGRQAVIYPVRSPGGWRLVGRTPLRLVDIAGEPRAAYRPGDRLRFVAMDADRWHDYAGRGLGVADG